MFMWPRSSLNSKEYRAHMPACSCSPRPCRLPLRLCSPMWIWNSPSLCFSLLLQKLFMLREDHLGATSTSFWRECLASNCPEDAGLRSVMWMLAIILKCVFSVYVCVGGAIFMTLNQITILIQLFFNVCTFSNSLAFSLLRLVLLPSTKSLNFLEMGGGFHLIS